MQISLEPFAAMRLLGADWAGTYDEAATGVIGERMAALRRRLGLAPDAQMFGVSWTDRPGGFRHFFGVRSRPEFEETGGLRMLALPALTCLTCTHPLGDATAPYARLMRERDERGLRRSDVADMIDEHLPGGTMRLWLPVTGG